MRFLGILLFCLAAAGMPDFIKAVRQHTGPGGDVHELSGRVAVVVLAAGGAPPRRRAEDLKERIVTAAAARWKELL
jgi:hypothetical protein